MDSKDFLNKIFQIEKEAQVWKWKFEGFHIWPLFRFWLYTHAPFTNKKNGSESLGKKGKMCFMAGSFGAVFQLIKNAFFPIKHIFISNNSIRTEVNGVYYDRVIDPFIIREGIPNKNYVLMDFTGDFVYHRKNFQNERIIKIQPLYIFITFILSKIGKKKIKNAQFEDFSIVSTKISKIYNTVKFSKNKLNQILAQHSIQVKVWKLFFKLLKPKKLYINCYYDAKGISATQAAKTLGIQVVDLQHGLQGKKHLAYGSWTPEVKETSSLLPDFFYVWDEVSKQNIKSWGGKAKMKGYAWIDLWKEHYFKVESPIDKRIVVFSLQPVPELFPDIFFELMDKIPSEYSLYLRLHPLSKSNTGEVEKIKQRLGKERRVSIQKATNLPLPYILAHSKLHITHWSTVALEAYNFDIKTFFLSEKGVHFFQGYLPDEYILDKVKEVTF